MKNEKFISHATMKTIITRLRLALILHFAFCILHSARAVLPEPDNVIFGTIYRDGVLVTAADYDVVVQVRRTPTGPALATYQMGSNPRLGNFYSVRVKLESLTPTLDAEASQPNDLLYLVVTDYNGDRATTNFVAGQRGAFHQVNVGASAGPDGDGDGLPDAWEAINGITGNGSGDRDGDGVSDRNEYFAGTNPNSPNDLFRLTIAQSGSNKSVSFFARLATGVGYEGRIRVYDLQYTTNLALGPWLGVSAYTNLLGNNSTVTYQTTGSPAPVFYRGKVQLQ